MKLSGAVGTMEQILMGRCESVVIPSYEIGSYGKHLIQTVSGHYSAAPI